MNKHDKPTQADFAKRAKAAGFTYIDSNHDSYGEFWIAGNPNWDFSVFYTPKTSESPDAGTAIVVHAEDAYPWKDDGTTWDLDLALEKAAELSQEGTTP